MAFKFGGFTVSQKIDISNPIFEIGKGHKIGSEPSDLAHIT